MIEKLKITASDTAIMLKINELVDAVNILQPAKDAMFYAIRNIQNRITALDDPTYHKAEPESSENIPGPIKLYVCPDGSVYDNEDVAKSHAASMFNPLPAGATTTDRIYLEQELDRTKKQLEIAIDALKSAHDYYEYCIQRDKDYGGDDINWDCTAMNMDNDISEALEQITALEQKEAK